MRPSPAAAASPPEHIGAIDPITQRSYLSRPHGPDGHPALVVINPFFLPLSRDPTPRRNATGA